MTELSKSGAAVGEPVASASPSPTPSSTYAI